MGFAVILSIFLSLSFPPPERSPHPSATARKASPRTQTVGQSSQKDKTLLSKVIKISCVIASVAFVIHATLVSFLKAAGSGRFLVSIILIGYAILLLSFLRRQRWSWLFVLIFTPAIVVSSIFIPPNEYFYGSSTSIAKILVFIEALACAVVFVVMLLPATKVWFTESQVLEDINKEEFHKGEVLEVTYRNNFWDIVWFNLYQTPRSRSNQISFVIAMLLIASIISSALNDTEFSVGIKIVVYLMVVIPLIFGITMLNFGILGFIYILRQFDIRAMQDCRLSISESGMITETPFKNKAIKWSAITKIQQNSKYIMFYLTDTAALLIPKRCFVGKVDPINLFSHSQQYLEKSRNANLLK